MLRRVRAVGGVMEVAAQLIAANPVLFEVIRWVGVAYLLRLAWVTWRQAARLDPGRAPRSARPFRDGMLELQNPEVRALPGPAGSVILMHCLLPHSSLPNHSSSARRTLIFEYRASDALPILYSARAADTEEKARQLKGSPASFARLAGPPPRIPHLDNNKSLYQLQEETQGEEEPGE